MNQRFTLDIHVLILSISMTKRCIMKMEDMPNPNEMKKIMMKKMMGDKKKSDMMKKCMKCMGHMEELVELNKKILAELKKLRKSNETLEKTSVYIEKKNQNKLKF